MFLASYHSLTKSREPSTVGVKPEATVLISVVAHFSEEDAIPQDCGLLDDADAGQFKLVGAMFTPLSPIPNVLSVPAVRFSFVKEMLYSNSHPPFLVVAFQYHPVGFPPPT